MARGDTKQKIAEFLAAHPRSTVADIVRATKLPASTVKLALKDAAGGWVEDGTRQTNGTGRAATCYSMAESTARSATVALDGDAKKAWLAGFAPADGEEVSTFDAEIGRLEAKAEAIRQIRGVIVSLRERLAQWPGLAEMVVNEITRKG